MLKYYIIIMVKLEFCFTFPYPLFPGGIVCNSEEDPYLRDLPDSSWKYKKIAHLFTKCRWRLKDERRGRKSCLLLFILFFCPLPHKGSECHVMGLGRMEGVVSLYYSTGQGRYLVSCRVFKVWSAVKLNSMLWWK